MSEPDQQSQALKQKPLISLTFPSPSDRKRHQELLAKPDRTKVDKIRNRIDGDALLPSGEPLPAWKEYPVDKKFPVVPANDGVFGFSRGAIGQELFPRRSDYAFKTDDPLIKETPKGYEPMHDPHLRHYFKEHPKLRERMLDEGLLEKPGDGVKAHMKDWNIYRSYLAKRKNDKVSENLKTQSNLRKKERDQLREILSEEKKAERKVKDDKRKELVDSVRNERRAREFHAQMQSAAPDVRDRLEEERAMNVAINATRRELLHQQVKERIGKLRKAERKRARKIIIEWYCKQLYADMMRKALRSHKKALHEADLDSFVGTKREFQEHKLKYLQALEDRRQAERECRINKRISQCEKSAQLMGHARDLQKEKEERELAFVRKFAMRWLNYIREQKKRASAYHDSIWRVRTQLIELVTGLKKETGRVSFTSFIKGLVSLKPGKETNEIQMDEETKDVMNYILDLLIKAAYDTYKKHNHPCKHAYEKQANRRRIRGEPDIPPEDFETPPRYVGRDQPNVPFPEIFLPCGSICVGMREGYEEDPECEAAALADAELKRQLRLAGYKKGLRKNQMDKQSSAGSSTVAERLSKAAIRKAGNKVCKDGKPCMDKGSSAGSSSVAEGLSKAAIRKAGNKLCNNGQPCDDATTSAEKVVRKSIDTAKKRHKDGLKWRGEDQGSSTGSSTVAEKLSNAAIVRASTAVVDGATKKQPVKATKKGEATKKGGATKKGDTRKGSANSSAIAERLSKAAIKKAGAGLCRDGTEEPCDLLESDESANSTSEEGDSSGDNLLVHEPSGIKIKVVDTDAPSKTKLPNKTEKTPEIQSEEESEASADSSVIADELSVAAIKTASTVLCTEDEKPCDPEESAEEHSIPEKVVESSPESAVNKVKPLTSKTKGDVDESSTPTKVVPSSPKEDVKEAEPTSSSKGEVGVKDESMPEKVVPSSPKEGVKEKEAEPTSSSKAEAGVEKDSTPEKVAPSSPKEVVKELEAKPTSSSKGGAGVDEDSPPPNLVERSPESVAKEVEPSTSKSKDAPAEGSTPEKVVSKSPMEPSSKDKVSTPEKVVPTPEKSGKEVEPSSASKAEESPDKVLIPEKVVDAKEVEPPSESKGDGNKVPTPEKVVDRSPQQRSPERATKEVEPLQREKDTDEDSTPDRVLPPTSPEKTTKEVEPPSTSKTGDADEDSKPKEAVVPSPQKDPQLPGTQSDEDSVDSSVVADDVSSAAIKRAVRRICREERGKPPPAPPGAETDDDDSNVEKVVRKSLDGAKKALCSNCSSDKDDDDSNVEKVVRKSLDGAKKALCSNCSSEEDEDTTAEKLVQKGIKDATSGMKPSRMMPSGRDEDERVPENASKNPTSQSEGDSEDSADSSVVADELSRAAIKRAVSGLCTGGGDIGSFGRGRNGGQGTSLSPKKSVKGGKSSTKTQKKPGMESDEDSSYAAEEIVWRSIAEVAKSEALTKRKGSE